MLERFMTGASTHDEGRQVVAHLLTGCAQCREVTAPSSPFESAFGGGQGPAVAARPGLLDALRRHESLLARERDEAPSVLAELEAHGHARGLLLVRNSRRFSTWGLTEHVIEQSYRHRFADAARARELAELGVELATRLDGEVYGEAGVRDLQARSLAMRGNMLRISSDLRGASRCFDEARELLATGSGDPIEEARFCEQLATLRCDQRRFRDAIRLGRRALRLYRSAGSDDRIGQAEVSLAAFLARGGERAGAIEQLQKTLPRLTEPRIVLAARHNLALFLQEEGRLEEALRVLADAKSLYTHLGEDLSLLRLRWLEGRLAGELGDMETAERALETVCDAFTSRSMPLDAAHATLDLAAIYLATDRPAAVYPLVAAIESIFRAQEVEPEALAAWLLLRKAVVTRAVDQALLREVAVRLEAVRRR